MYSQKCKTWVMNNIADSCLERHFQMRFDEKDDLFNLTEYMNIYRSIYIL